MNDDPRWARSREAIRTAAASLLEREGPPAVTHARIAVEAGVSRATVYRHWSRTEPLLLEIMAAGDPPFLLGPTPPIRTWLHTALRELADELALPAVRATVTTLLSGRLWDPDMAAQCDTLIGTLDGRVADALSVAHRAGEIGALPDPADAAARLIGPLVYRTALQAATVSDAMIEALVRDVLPD